MPTALPLNLVFQMFQIKMFHSVGLYQAKMYTSTPVRVVSRQIERSCLARVALRTNHVSLAVTVSGLLKTVMTQQSDWVKEISIQNQIAHVSIMR